MSTFTSQYNTRSPAVKRLMKEAQELREPTELYTAQPLEDNLFEWHFSVRGPPDSDFDGGIYHGRIILPPDYPMKPPNVILLTPNGRFELHKKICLSISGYHPESWQPSWSIRTALLALIGFMPTHSLGAIGSLDYPPLERRKLAKQSHAWSCKECGHLMANVLPALTDASAAQTAEARDLASKVAFKDESEIQATKQQKQNEATKSSPFVEKSETVSPGNINEQKNPTETVTNTTTTQMASGNIGQSETGTNIGDIGQNQLRQQNNNNNNNSQSGRAGAGMGSLLFMLGLVFMLAVLLFRRVYMSNEWRFFDGDRSHSEF